MKNIDLVYVLGTGSAHSDFELQYSLRSVYQHLKGFRNIYIVGERPSFLRRILHIPFADKEPGNPKWKELNIFNKILAASELDCISESFLFMNDDYFLVADTVAADIPNYYFATIGTEIQKRKPSSSYMKSLMNTQNLLTWRESTQLYFDIHYPIRYNKHLIRNMAESHDWNVEYGYTVKSLYGNTFRISAEQKQDCKLYQPFHLHQLRDFTRDKFMFTTGDYCLDAPTLQVIRQLYPNPSPYEL